MITILTNVNDCKNNIINDIDNLISKSSDTTASESEIYCKQDQKSECKVANEGDVGRQEIIENNTFFIDKQGQQEDEKTVNGNVVVVETYNTADGEDSSKEVESNNNAELNKQQVRSEVISPGTTTSITPTDDENIPQKEIMNTEIIKQSKFPLLILNKIEDEEKEEIVKVEDVTKDKRVNNINLDFTNQISVLLTNPHDVNEDREEQDSQEKSLNMEKELLEQTIVDTEVLGKSETLLETENKDDKLQVWDDEKDNENTESITNKMNNININETMGSLEELEEIDNLKNTNSLVLAENEDQNKSTNIDNLSSPDYNDDNFQVGKDAKKRKYNENGSPVKSKLLKQSHDVCLVTTKKEPISLVNVGVNCYMNAAMQCIFPALLHLYRKEENHGCDIPTDYQALHLMIKFIKAYEENVQFSIPDNINLPYFSSELSLDNQEDAHEFLNCYLDKLNEEIKKLSKSAKSPFEITHDARVFCDSCKKSNNENPIMAEDQVIFVNVGESMNDMIKKSMENNIEEFNCENCHIKNGTASSSVVFCQIPKFLVVCIKRFSFDYNYYGRKITDNIEIEEFIDIPQKQKGDVVLKRYQLVSIVNHVGRVSGGHYFSYLKDGDIWYVADDEIIKQISFEDVLKHSVSTCYIQVYNLI